MDQRSTVVKMTETQGDAGEHHHIGLPTVPHRLRCLMSLGLVTNISMIYLSCSTPTKQVRRHLRRGALQGRQGLDEIKGHVLVALPAAGELCHRRQLMERVRVAKIQLNIVGDVINAVEFSRNPRTLRSSELLLSLSSQFYALSCLYSSLNKRVLHVIGAYSGSESSSIKCVHLKERPFQCDRCEAAFGEKGNLKCVCPPEMHMSRFLFFLVKLTNTNQNENCAVR